MNVEEKKCPICGRVVSVSDLLLRYENMPRVAQYLPEKDALDKDHGSDLNICQCSSCGLVQLANEPVSYYREVIRASGFSPLMRDFRKKQFSDFVGRQSLRGKKVVEIGCGQGEYLSIMSECGVSAHGLEYNENNIAKCLEAGLKADKGFVETEDYQMPGGPYDAFFMMSFLEHLPDPKKTLRGICNNLADGAVGIIEVPNFDMMLRQELFSEFMSDHLFYFTAKSLTLLLEQSGFEVEECKEVWHEYIISAEVRKRKRLDLSALGDRRREIEKQLDEYIAECGGSVAIWGAGHEALANMALYGLSDKIKYVVDSAPFKQGKFTPATHLPILSPDRLKADPVEAVIIMAGSYGDEIAALIPEKYGPGLKTAILRSDGLHKIQ